MQLEYKNDSSSLPVCKGTGWAVVHDVGWCTSDSSLSSGEVNTKTVASVLTSTLLTSVIKRPLASDVASCLVPIAWLLEGMSYSATDLSGGLLSCNLLPVPCLLCKLLVCLVEIFRPFIWIWLLHSILEWPSSWCGMTSSLGLIID